MRSGRWEGERAGTHTGRGDFAVKTSSKYKLTIEAAHIVTPAAEGGVFSAIGNKPAKLHIAHDGAIAGWDLDSALNADRQIGLQDCIVGPGFIDLHFHGYGEQSTATYPEIGSFQNPRNILEKLPSFGTTSTLATLLVPVQSRHFFGVDLDARFKMLKSRLTGLVHENPSADDPRARLLGLHLEGPKINPEVSGAIPPSSIWNSSVRDIVGIIAGGEREYGDHGVRIMTVAPEMDHANDFKFIRTLVDLGVVVALGHSNASLEQTIAAIKAGARHLTHLFNAMGPFAHRKPGIVGAGLIDPRVFNAQELGLSAEIICDFIHVDPALLSLAVSQHPLIAGVSDAVAHPGMGDGTYEFAGQRVTIADNAVRLISDGRLAGSAMTMLQTFRNLMLLGGDQPDMRRVFQITSTNPATIIGREDIGRIEKGRRADLVIFDNDYNLLYTLVDGEIVYESPHAKNLANARKTAIRITREGSAGPSDVKGRHIGIRISDSSLWCGYVVDGDRVVITSKGEQSNPRHKQGFTGREAILDNSSEAIVNAWRKASKNGAKVHAVGIATSGLVDGSRAVMAMNLPAWKDFDIAGELLRRARAIDSGFPADIPMYVENSANAMAMAISRTRKLRAANNLEPGENFIYIKIGWGFGTGVVIDGKPINCISGIAEDYHGHLRTAIQNVHLGLPTYLHQTVLINRLIALGELALMRTCDDEYPDMHLEALVSRWGIIHYARETEKKAGRIFFRKDRFNEIIRAIKKDPYSLENMAMELPLSIGDVIDALDASGEASAMAASVFERMGMALGSGVFSLANTLEAPIDHIVILPQIGGDFTKAIEYMRRGIMTSLSRSGVEESVWKVNFMKPNENLYVLAGASLCYQ